MTAHSETGNSRHQKVYLAIREQILEGQLSGGTRLIESELAEAFSVSRTPVREAMFRLAQERLVNISDGGAHVSVIKQSDIVEAYQVRGALEGLAGSLAASHCTPIDVLELNFIIQRTEHHMNQRKFESVIDDNSEFHAFIASLSNNTFLVHSLKELHPYTHFYRRNVLNAIRISTEAEYTYVQHLKENLVDHKRIVQLLQAGSGSDLTQILRTHMESSSDCMIRILEQVARHDPATGILDEGR